MYNYDKDDRIKKEGFKTGSGILGMAYSYDGIGRTTVIERGTATVGSEQALTVSGKSELKSSYSYLGGDTGLYGSKAASRADRENQLRGQWPAIRVQLRRSGEYPDGEAVQGSGAQCAQRGV